MSKKDDILECFDQLLQDALAYQLSVRGPYLISKESSKTSILNEEFDKFSLQFISSHRLDFDGGIEVDFLASNSFGENLLRVAGSNSIKVDIFNLESTDGEFDLDAFYINEFEDCDRLHVKFDFRKLSDAAIEKLYMIVSEHIASHEVGVLRTYLALAKK